MYILNNSKPTAIECNRVGLRVDNQVKSGDNTGGSLSDAENRYHPDNAGFAGVAD